MNSEGGQSSVGVGVANARGPRGVRRRRRYLGVEIVGSMPSPGTLRRILLSHLEKGGDDRSSTRMDFRVVKARGRYALVEVPNTMLLRARSSWNSGEVRTHRTWGTLKRGKVWLTVQGGGGRVRAP